MTSKAHEVGAIMLGYGIIYASNKFGIKLQAIYVLGGSWLGGLLPDIDHPKSKLGRMIQPVSNIIFASIGHRSFTHSLLFTSIIGLVFFFLNASIGVGLTVGVLSHITLDLLTPETNGVAFLYPFYKKRIKILNLRLCKAKCINIKQIKK